MSLIFKDLKAGIEDTPILKGVNLEIPKGEVHAIMGPNGSGKSTLSKVACGHEDYEVESGSVEMDGKDLLDMEVDSNANFLRAARQARLPDGQDIDAVAFYKEMYERMDELEMDRKFTGRSVNEGFSGGEKKRNEILQMMMLDPKYCILDETDSGLDIDALKIVAQGVNSMRSPERGFLIITHYQRLLDYIQPDVIHVMYEGRIVKTGGKELAHELEANGYDFLKEEALA